MFLTDMNKRERERLLAAFENMRLAAEAVVEALEREDDEAFAITVTTCAIIWQQASQETLQVLKDGISVDIPDTP